MKATVENKVIACNKKGYALKMKVSECLPFPLPPLVVTFETKLSSAKTDVLLAAGCTTFNQGKEVYYKFTDYKPDIIPALMTHDPKPNTRTRVMLGTTNLNGLKSFFTCLRIITAFLRVHSYPAFDGPLTGDMGGRFDSIPEFITSKRKGLFENRGGKKPRLDDDDVAMDTYDEDADELGVEDLGFGQGGTAAERVPKARPTDPCVINAGPASTAPTLPGLLFPYFPGLLDDDRQFIPQVVRTYFMQTLGNDREEMCSAFQEFKGGCGTWASSEIGRVMQHIFAGVQMALESQTRIYLLLDKEKYHGFTLHGWYFHVSIYDRVYVPLGPEELAIEVRKSDEHACALAGIIRLLKTLKLDKSCPRDFKTLPTKFADVKGARHLHELITWRIRTDEQNEEIDKLVSEVAFTQRFRPFTPDNIILALEWVTGAETIPVDEPMYLGGGIARRTERCLEAFSVFGELGPSFIVPGGRGIKIPASVELDTQLDVKGKGPPPLDVMVLSKKPLIACMNDWETLVRSGVYLNRKERSTAFKSIRITDKAEIRKIWHFLIENIGAKNAAVEEETHFADTKVLGKRTERDDDDEFESFF